ncbi:MAG TPA: protein-disulfide reductase DsbD domain-containing protein [Candidatus Angelobacter sp.]|nr:protein-disulfide reductase DsbD domain-containing protein [Candidatus Angelobacter sp.]
MRRYLPVVGTIAVLLASVLPAQEVSPLSRGYVDFEPLSTVSASRGKSTPVQFTFHIKSGYHINSSKPLEPELIPTSLTFSLPPDVVIAKVQYPAGELTSFPFDPSQKLSVYTGDVNVKAVILPTTKASTGNYTVHGEFKYQACDNNACYPPKKLPVQFDVKILAGAGKRAQTPRIR